jgi:1,4-dihydroxy-2-naphthoate octaprenyltransferase
MNVQFLKQKGFFGLIVYGARPKTLVASFFPVILGMLLARFDHHYDIVIYLYTLFSALFLQIGTNYANDLFDHKAQRDTSHRLGPPRLGALGLLSQKELSILTFTSFFISAILAIPLIVKGGILIVFLLLLALFLGIFYSYGRYSLANTGLANIVVFIVFGPLGTAITYYLQSQSYSANAVFFGCLPGALSLMLFAMNNLRDMQEDKKGNKKTLVVRFGFLWGKIEYMLFLFIALVIPPLGLLFFNAPLITLLPLILLKQGFSLSHAVYKAFDSLEIVPLFEKTAMFNTLYALLTIIGWRIATL